MYSIYITGSPLREAFILLAKLRHSIGKTLTDKVYITLVLLIKQVNCKYVFQIYDYFTKKQEQKEYAYIFMDYDGKGNLVSLNDHKIILNSRIIWRILIQIVLGIKSFHSNDIILKKLCPQNIFIDKENNVKIGGFGLNLDFTTEDNENLLALYDPPEIFNGKNYNKKSDMWALGCVLYELIFKKKPFQSLNHILNINYEISNECENDFKYILSKLLCHEITRISINDLFIDMIFKKKIVEINFFYEIVKDNIKGKIFILYN